MLKLILDIKPNLLLNFLLKGIGNHLFPIDFVIVHFVIGIEPESLQ